MQEFFTGFLFSLLILDPNRVTWKTFHGTIGNSSMLLGRTVQLSLVQEPHVAWSDMPKDSNTRIPWGSTGH